MEPQFYQSYFDFFAEILDAMEAHPDSVRCVHVAVVAAPTARPPLRDVQLLADAILGDAVNRRLVRLRQSFGIGARPAPVEPFDKAYRAADDLRLRLRRLGLEPRSGTFRE